MSRRFEPQRRRGRSGFTLIELLVVLTIFGLAAAAVVLAIPDPGGGLTAEAERFAARAKTARDMALLESRAVALEIGPGGYAVVRRSGGAWQPAAQYEWENGTRPETGPAAQAQERVVFDPTGLVDPLFLTLRRRDDRVAIEIGHDGAIAIRR